MSPGDRRRVLATAAACVFLNFLAFSGLTPLFPEVAHDLGLGVDTLGLYFAVSAAVSVALQISVGVVADRVGRRPVLVTGLLFMAAGQALRWQATTPLIFGAGQLAIGACSPLIVAAGFAAVADAYARAGRAQGAGCSAGYLLPFVARQFGYGEAATSLLLIPYVLGSIVASPLLGRWADRVGIAGLLAGCLSAAALALAAFGLLPFSLPA